MKVWGAEMSEGRAGGSSETEGTGWIVGEGRGEEGGEGGSMGAWTRE